MSVRDLRFYNEDTKQWENLLASNVDLLKVDTKVENHIKDLIPHLQPGERELIVNSLQVGQQRLSNIDANTIMIKGIYPMGDNIENIPGTFYGTLAVYVSEDVVTQVYYDINGLEYVRSSIKDGSGARIWREWNTTATTKELAKTNGFVDSIYKRYNPEEIIKVKDWDTIYESGLYQATNDIADPSYATNGPSTYMDWYVGEYFAHNYEFGALIVQGLLNPSIRFVRSKKAGIWGPWKLTTYETPVFYDAVLENGFTGQVRYSKSRDGIVTVTLSIKNIPTIAASTIVSSIPSGYAPNTYMPIMVLLGNLSPFSVKGSFVITEYGSIQVAYESGLQTFDNAGLMGVISYATSKN